MVHTRNGSSYPVQTDGPGQGRGNTRTTSAKCSSRKTHLEDSRASPLSPRAVPASFDVNSEPEQIEGNILRAEPLPRGSHQNISVPIQKFVQRSKRRGVGNIPQCFAGGYELLLTHQEFSGSGEDHRSLRRVEPIVFQRQAPEASKETPKGPQKKKKGPKKHQGKGKGKVNWHRPYQQGYKIPKLEPSAVDSVFNMASTIMELVAKEQENMNRNFPCK
ncbi:hypothetical protein O181_131889 [Austropuccinia psidii MF-1]|uniref:Uncharacterized protein n=1 Tax=Austropuccinia psidii MF-1 TaxID=1389203 RepID=A0A9Q3QBJ3_9BASI|nr:hypothetical protein [Austropuccinia psidii MF-1]